MGINVGWAQGIITPDRPIFVSGQMYPRISSYIHDDLTCTALVLENDDQQYIQVSLDMVNIPISLANKFRNKLKGISGLEVEKIGFNGTHTHNSMRGIADPYQSDFEKYLGKERISVFDKPDNLLYGEAEGNFIADKVYEIVESAWNNRTKGGVSFGSDYACVGFNRRPVFTDDNKQEYSKMYGPCNHSNFVRFEGPVDHSLEIMFTCNENMKLTGVIVNVPCPSQVHELHKYISADYWSATRTEIRKAFGDIYILPICGAAGDQNPLDLIKLAKDNEREFKLWNAQAGEVFRNFDMDFECRKIGKRITDGVLRAFEMKTPYEFNPVFKHNLLSLILPIRKVELSDYEEAVSILNKTKKQFDSKNKMKIEDMVSVFEPIGVIKRWERQNEEPEYKITCHIIRIGKHCICTNPFELFVEYGQRIKSRSKATQTFIIQLCDDALAYLPTEAALKGGSYSSKPASTVMGPNEGNILVESTISEIDKLWQ